MSAQSTIDLDSNATTPIDPRVLDAMLPLLRGAHGNASSRHHLGAAAAKALAAARRTVAGALGASAAEIVFTSGGTEADNLAICGVVRAAEQPRHVITTAVEHPAVLETCRALARRGECELTVLGVSCAGEFDFDAFRAALRPGRTCLVSVMWANNETGVLFPIPEIAELARQAGALVHVDAVQAVGRVPMQLEALPVDLLSLSAHKLHGPKGAGALFVRRGVRLEPLLTGGGQEHGRRSGTENPAAISGLAMAVRLAVEALPHAAPRMALLRDRLEQGLLAAIPNLQVTAQQAPRVCNTSHVTFADVEADALLLALDREGIAASPGSACSSGALTASHVLQAMALPAARLHNAVRFSLSRNTTADEIEAVLTIIPPISARLARLAQPGEA